MTSPDVVTKRNIVLTGFMGSGKTSIGRIVARDMGWTFVDSDSFITQRHGPISDIFAEHGEEYFRQIESQAAEAIAQGSRQVIATGGGMLLSPRNSVALNSTGRTFTMATTSEAIIQRLGPEAGKKRPLLAGDNPESVIRSMMADRANIYSSFPQFSTQVTKMEGVAERIINFVKREPSRVEGHGGNTWWVGGGVMGAAAALAGHDGAPIIAVVDEESSNYAPATGATRALVVGKGNSPDVLVDQLRKADSASVVVAVGSSEVLSAATAAAKLCDLAIVGCPTSVDLACPTETVVLELAVLQGEDPGNVADLNDLWGNVLNQLAAGS